MAKKSASYKENMSGSFANMPDKVVMKPYPKSPYDPAGYVYDDLAGIDYQMMEDVKGQKKQKFATKY